VLHPPDGPNTVLGGENYQPWLDAFFRFSSSALGSRYAKRKPKQNQQKARLFAAHIEQVWMIGSDRIGTGVFSGRPLIATTAATNRIGRIHSHRKSFWRLHDLLPLPHESTRCFHIDSVNLSFFISIICCSCLFSFVNKPDRHARLIATTIQRASTCPAGHHASNGMLVR